MNYRVLKPFKNIDGAFLTTNDTIECNQERARILFNNGIIGGIVETAEKIFPVRPEKQLNNAINKTITEKRKYRKRKS